MSLQDLITALRLDRGFMDRVCAWERLPARPARHAPFPEGLAPEIVTTLQRRGVEALFSHQAASIAATLRGEHVVVVTPTASGKTLCYNLPVLHALRADPRARALYLFPTKALAQDQLAELKAWNEWLAAPVPAQTYDGDTPQERRKAARSAGGIVLSNPDMLHVGILPHHTRWAAFFQNLRFIVIDELHAYRGVFGSHMANVLRRLGRICRFYGSAPQFICTSATIANPREHAERLIEQPVTLIGAEQNGAPSGEKHFLLLNPPITDRELGLRRSVVLESKDFAARLLAAGIQTIVFARARMTVELLLTYLRDEVAYRRNRELESEVRSPKSEVGGPGSGSRGPGRQDRTQDSGTSDSGLRTPDLGVRGYRGGYLPNERRAIEEGLRTGRVQAVVATNALELGIDIGQLGACVMAGYPGTIASTWQQAGRAGRRTEVSLAALIASGSPLDQYIATHPRYLFERSPEHALINPDNLAILARHVECAAGELPFEAGEPFGRYASLDELLDYFVEQGVLVRTATRYVWVADRYPPEGVSLRTGTDDTIVIQDRSQASARVIGEMDRASAPRLLHAGAVYWHEGQQYLVTRLGWENAIAEVKAEDLDYYTDASESATVEVLETYAEDRAPRADPEEFVGWAHGEVKVTAQMTGYRKIKRYTHETLGWGQIELPAQELQTTAYWLWFSEKLAKRLEAEGLLLAPNDYGPNWPETRDRVRARDGYRCRTCGAPERPGRQHDVHHLRPFREFGYVHGENENYLEANDPGNLVTLCAQCHHRAETALGRTSALSGLGNVLGNLAPLYLMCDPHDLSFSVESRAAGTNLPTITIYERVPGGVGLSQRLFELHAQLLQSATELVSACRCDQGCPACVGPAGEVGTDAKALTKQLLQAMGGGQQATGIGQQATGT